MAFVSLAYVLTRSVSAGSVELFSGRHSVSVWYSSPKPASRTPIDTGPSSAMSVNRPRRKRVAARRAPSGSVRRKLPDSSISTRTSACPEAATQAANRSAALSVAFALAGRDVRGVRHTEPIRITHRPTADASLCLTADPPFSYPQRGGQHAEHTDGYARRVGECGPPGAW